MKRYFIIIFSSFLILRLISSCAAGKFPADKPGDIQKDSSSFRIPVTIEPFKLDILPPSLGVQFYRDGIIFLADSKNEENISSGHVSFGTVQAYYAPLKDSLGPHTIFSPKPLFPYPCDALTFSPDFGTMYYTKTTGKEQKEKIFLAENFMIGENRQMWTFEPAPLPFCKEESIYTHPALSADGKLLIFASDMKGSMGGMDLFISRSVDMRWGEPESLGKFINTKGNELFPVLDRNNNLFFSSDGFKTSEGYDIFLCRYNGKGWDFPVKLSGSINTKNDEFAFTIDRVIGNSAFFTSVKKSRNSVMQLYRIIPEKNLLNADKNDLTSLIWDISASNIDSTEIKLYLNQLEADRVKADSLEKARIEALRQNAARIREDSLAAVKLAARRLEDERLRAEKLRIDSIAAVKEAARKLENDRLIAGKLRNDSIASAKVAAQKMEAERLKAEKLRIDSVNAARQAAIRLSADRLKIRNDSMAAAEMMAKRLEAERIKAINKRKADSLNAVKLKAEELRAERERAEKFRADSIAAAKNKENALIRKDEIYYKVQILTTVKPKDEFDVPIDGENYKATRYLYLNEYRYIIGVFSSVGPARELQNKARVSGWPQAFVVAFRNGERSNDKALFK